MNFKVKQLSIVGGCITLPLPDEEKGPAMSLMQDVQNGKTLTVEIKRFNPKRSLDANAYLWKVLTDIAVAVKSTKEEIYKEMLIKYGTAFTHIVLRPEAVAKFKAEWQGAVKDLGPVRVKGRQKNEQSGVQLQCFFGSSTYDSKEFAILLDGVLDEAKELGLEYINKADRDLLLKDWGK